MAIDNIGPESEKMERVSSDDHYWALAEGEKLVRHISARREEYWHFVKNSEIYTKIVRNWEYWLGLYYTVKTDPRMAIQLVGSQGEKALVSINYFHAFIHLLITYTVQNRPAWDTQAVNSDNRSIQQADLGNQILDYYFDAKNVEAMATKTVENAFIFSAGYLKQTWDEQSGKELDADPEALEIIYEGDVKESCPSFFDVYYDHTKPTYDESRWVGCQVNENKWEAIEKYPKSREEILKASKVEDPRFQYFGDIAIASRDPDNVLMDYWYHERTPAIPLGRMVAFVGKTVLFDGPMLYRKKPIHRFTVSDLTLTPHGWTPAFDLQGPQEFLNMIFSILLTDLRNLGHTKIWSRAQEQINIADLEPGVSVIQTETEPKPLKFNQTDRSTFDTINIILQGMERSTGVNAVNFGQPEASLKSGAALALVDAKAMQFNSLSNSRYFTFLGEVGSELLNILKTRTFSKRIISIAGKDRMSELKEFWAESDLDSVDRVIVQPGNPLLRTTAGRKEMATELLQTGLIATPEEYTTLINSGQIRPLTRTIDSQLKKVRYENESLRNLGPHGAMVTDNHTLHIKEHSAILDSPETYGDPQLAKIVLAAVLEHVQMLQDQSVQVLMVTLGYPSPIMPPAPGTKAGQEGKPGPGGEPGKPGISAPDKAKGPKPQVPGAPPVGAGQPESGGDQSARNAA